MNGSNERRHDAPEPSQNNPQQNHAGISPHDSIEKTAQDVLKIAQTILQNRGKIHPHAMILDSVNETAYYLALAVDKVLWAPLILKMLQRINADRYFLVDEVWIVSSENWIPTRAVSENPAAVEAIIVVVCDRAQGKVMITQQFLRDKDEIKFMEPTTSNTFETRLGPEKW